MNILIADERKKYHQALLNNGVLTIDKNGVPSNADTSSRLSKAIAKDIADRLMAETHKKQLDKLQEQSLSRLIWNFLRLHFQNFK